MVSVNPTRAMIFAATYSDRVTDRERIESEIILAYPVIAAADRIAVAMAEIGAITTQM